MLQYQIIPVTPFQQNCTLFWCDETKQAAVVDPGGNAELIMKAIEQHGLTLTKVLLTHAHIDHAGATQAISSHYNVPIEGPHKEDQFWIDLIPEQKERFGFEHAEHFTPDRWLNQGDTVTFGNITLEVYFCPGHTPGHVVFFHRASKLAQVGDVLFKGSIGRTDFPRGDYNTLISSIKDNLFLLGDDVRFIPGHGPMGTFGEERRTNPFVGENAR
ncbi:MBL fold metallo-hydrolase [Thalassotalea piscium]|uniref:Glyoxylase-like metal-dependent hydrolase (Beta-lactamase superfamily II) n=1 Tax=Thalassotalea piscium TaxID=1230533 RepID=A0A7X0NIC1_9GAMM|nr:glyoxylase-like metal-dependent hydrolase (beta-lactamase superfamily II) [Thalassotalea piscium]